MNKSNKTLLQILVEELPKRGGWKPQWESATSFDGLVMFLEGRVWMPHRCICYRGFDVVTREQYEAALAAKNDGWIEWGGGEFPPASTNTVVDVKFKNGNVQSGYPAGEYSWEHVWQDCNIIAYRLHKPQEAEQAKADDEADLNECIGQQHSETVQLIITKADLLDEINSVGVNISLTDAIELANTLIDAGYRKQ